MPKALAKKIKSKDKNEIKAAVSGLKDLTLQKKAFMSLVASDILCKYLKEQDITIISENNNFSGLLLLKDFDIANIIAENNIKMAVRAFVGDDYPQMCIPRSHFLNDILADIYVGVRIESNIDKAELVGFIEVSQINRQNGNDKYVCVNVDQLKPIDNLKQTILLLDTKKHLHLPMDHQKTKELFFQYIENRISSSDKEFFVRHIASCCKCNQEFNHIIELDNKLKASGFSFEKDNKDFTLELFSGDTDLLGEEVEINFKDIVNYEIEDEDNENNLIESLFSGDNEFKIENLQDAPDEIIEDDFSLNRKNSKKNAKKHISNKKIGRVIKTAGKLAILSGTVVGSSHVIAGIQAASISGMVGSMASIAAANAIKGFADIDFNGGSDKFENAINSGGPDDNYNFDIDEKNTTYNNVEIEGPDFNLDELENDGDINFQDDGGIVNNMSNESFDLKGTEFPEILPEISKNVLADEEVDVNLLNTNEESVSLSDDEPKMLSLRESIQEENTAFSEIQHKDLSEENLTLHKQQELESDENDISGFAIECNIDDLLSSLDSVEVMDSSEFFDTGDSKEKAPQSELKLLDTVKEESETVLQEVTNPAKEEKEEILNDIYQSNESVPEEYRGMKFNTDSEDEQNIDEESLVTESAVPEYKKEHKPVLVEDDDEDEDNYYENNKDYDDNEDDEDDEDEDEDDDIDEEQSKKDKLRSLDKKIASGVAVAGIAVTIAVALWMNNKPLKNQDIPVLSQQPASQTVLPNPANSMALPQNIPAVPQKNPVQEQNTVPVETARPQTVSKAAPIPSKDLSAVLAEAFTRRTYEVNIRNISWEITADMAANPVFKNYILVTGQALKSALARDLSQSKERALNSQMEIMTVIDLNGNIQEAKVVQSSGSKEVDEICLAAYKTTIQFTKLPKINVNRDKINANLIISF